MRIPPPPQQVIPAPPPPMNFVDVPPPPSSLPFAGQTNFFPAPAHLANTPMPMLQAEILRRLDRQAFDLSMQAMQTISAGAQMSPPGPPPSPAFPCVDNLTPAPAMLNLAVPVQAKDARAPPCRRQFLRTKMCPLMSKGQCVDPECSYAHSMTQLRPLPDLRQTKLCEETKKGDLCLNPNCTYAHAAVELKPTSDLATYKTTLCFFWKKSKCFNGAKCRFAHGVHELRGKQLPDFTTQAAQASPAAVPPPPSSTQLSSTPSWLSTGTQHLADLQSSLDLQVSLLGTNAAAVIPDHLDSCFGVDSNLEQFSPSSLDVVEHLLQQVESPESSLFQSLLGTPTTVASISLLPDKSDALGAYSVMYEDFFSLDCDLAASDVRRALPSSVPTCPPTRCSEASLTPPTSPLALSTSSSLHLDKSAGTPSLEKWGLCHDWVSSNQKSVLPNWDALEPQLADDPFSFGHGSCDGLKEVQGSDFLLSLLD